MNERINQLEALLQEAHREPISEVAPVVQFDGIWLNLQTQQEGFKEDSRKKRHQKQGKRMVVLVALGLWADGSGKRHILDWEVADREETPFSPIGTVFNNLVYVPYCARCC